jgi:hypothetical protein
VATTHFVELAACSPDDPDGSRTATILSAYFHAERMKAFRRLLWRRLAILASIWSAIALTTSVLSRGATTAFFGIVGAVACWSAVLAWSADHRVGESLSDSLRSSTLP